MSCRMTTLLTSAVFALVLALPAAAQPKAEGLLIKASPHDLQTTITRFEKTAHSSGLKIFDTIDHAQAAAGADMQLAPTTLVLFGNPKAGTSLMQCARTLAIDLPLKALVWKDDDGQTWFAYNDIDYLAERHGITECNPVPKVRVMLDKLATKTVSEEGLDAAR